MNLSPSILLNLEHNFPILNAFHTHHLFLWPCACFIPNKIYFINGVFLYVCVPTCLLPNTLKAPVPFCPYYVHTLFLVMALVTPLTETQARIFRIRGIRVILPTVSDRTVHMLVISETLCSPHAEATNSSLYTLKIPQPEELWSANPGKSLIYQPECPDQWGHCSTCNKFWANQDSRRRKTMLLLFCAQERNTVDAKSSA